LEEAPEDIDTPLPCSFTDYLNFMEQSYEEALKAYLGQLEEHTFQVFRDSTDIIQLLQSKKAIEVFVPQNWNGVRGVEIDLKWKPELPERMKVNARPINPRLFEHAKIEYERLTRYMYIPSTSPIASPLVIASKATKPFIRFCGDYQAVNKYIDIGYYPIPDVRHALDDCIKYPIRADFDVTNAFHQFKLSPITRQRLSIVTPWQQVEPLFLPEGVGPASFILQEQMERVFAGLD
jgi:hypothetical protein